MGRAGPQNTSNSDVSRLAFFEYLRKSCEGSEERKGCGEWWTVAAGPLTALLLSIGSWFRTFFPRPHSFLSEPQHKGILTVKPALVPTLFQDQLAVASLHTHTLSF